LLHQLRYEEMPAPSDKILVATVDDNVVGSISLHALPLFHAVGFVGRVTSMVVDEHRRGGGVGGALIAAGALV
jgi:predicted N-acetyltransferase YhbS